MHNIFAEWGLTHRSRAKIDPANMTRRGGPRRTTPGLGPRTPQLKRTGTTGPQVADVGTKLVAFGPRSIESSLSFHTSGGLWAGGRRKPGARACGKMLFLFNSAMRHFRCCALRARARGGSLGALVCRDAPSAIGASTLRHRCTEVARHRLGRRGAACEGPSTQGSPVEASDITAMPSYASGMGLDLVGGAMVRKRSLARDSISACCSSGQAADLCGVAARTSCLALAQSLGQRPFQGVRREPVQPA